MRLNKQFDMQLTITPEMVAAENQLVCTCCGNDLWVLNAIAKIAVVPNPTIGQPPIDVNVMQHLCLSCLLSGHITLRTPQNAQRRCDATDKGN